MKLIEQLFSILSDGRFHSGAKLSQKLEVSRSSIWNGIEKLKSMGLEVFAVKGQGYRLAEPIEPLNKDYILQHIKGDLRQHVPHVDLHWNLDSTNRYLLDLAKYGALSGHACLAEFQSAGRGRRGRSWVSPFGGNVYLSQLWRFPGGPSTLGGLSLAAAVAVAKALKQLGVEDFYLKWPNDVLSNGKKLAGILLEISGEASGPTVVVAGIGINVQINNDVARQIDQPWIALNSLCRSAVSRNKLVGILLSELVTMFIKYERGGLAPFLSEWEKMDGFAGHRVQLKMHDKTITGIACGIDSDGSLKLDIDGAIRTYHSGEVSLRPAQ